MEEQFVGVVQELNYQQENQLEDIVLEEAVEDPLDVEKIDAMNVAIEVILHVIVVVVEDVVAGKNIDFVLISFRNHNHLSLVSIIITE